MNELNGKKNSFIIVIVCIISCWALNSYAGVAVSPLLQELSLSPGTEATFYINLDYRIREPGSQPTKVHLSVVDFTVSRQGNLSFCDAGTTKKSCANWIKLESTDVTIAPGEKRKVACQISVPRSAVGERYAAILVDIGEPGKVTGTGVGLQFRIASGVFLTIRGRIFPKIARVSELKVQLPSETDQKEEVKIIATVANKGQVRFIAEGEALIRDKEGRIFGRIPLEAGRKRILPGDIRDFAAVISNPLASGEYVIETRFNYGSKYGRARAQTDFSVTPEIAQLLAKSQVKATAWAPVNIEPAKLELNVAPGGFRTAPISISSKEFEPIQLEGYFKDFTIGPDGKMVYLKTGQNKFSCTKWLTLGPSKFTLGPGQSRKMGLSVRVPKNAGSEHYAKLFFKGGPKDTEIIEGPIVFINTARTIKKAGEISTLLVKHKVDEPSQFTLSFKNSGNTHLSCKAALTIRDDRGLIDSISIKEGQLVLPDGIRNFVLASKKKLPPGKYTAEATIDYGGETPAKITREFQVQ